MSGLPNSRKHASPCSPPEMAPESVVKEEEKEEPPAVLTPTRKSMPIISTPARADDKEEENCVTPSSEDRFLKPSLVCPPAPRKPRQAKRKFGRPVRELFVVTCELESVFPILAAPTKKKLRTG